MEQHFPKFLKKKTTSRGVYPNFENFFPGSFLSIHFCSRISRIFGWMVHISEIQKFSGNFYRICRCFQIFESFGWMESAICLSSLVCFRSCPTTQNSARAVCQNLCTDKKESPWRLQNQIQIHSSQMINYSRIILILFKIKVSKIKVSSIRTGHYNLPSSELKSPLFSLRE